MRNILLTTVTTIVVGFASNAAQAVPDFKTLSNFNLACESIRYRNNNPNDYAHVWFEIVPSENTVKMTNEKGETFSFTVTKTMTSVTNARNEFGNYVTVPYAAWIWFNGIDGESSQIRQWSSSLNPYSRVSYMYDHYVQGGDGYACIVTH